ncbi:MAG: mechanosensitive ion channel family protein [Actinomycetota bacterium]|nr:mechanosensitive ion channel family protein [Actinomycetota bacterium]
MRQLDLAIPASSFVDRHGNEITAIASVLIAIVLAILANRALAHRARTLARAVARGELSPVADTRLRFVRRLVAVAIVALGVMIAITQFGPAQRAATSLLASSALAAAVIGFAARQVLANAVAGVMLAITQPLRIGDRVSFEGEEGTVEDVRLNYTYLRTGTGTRLVIPNERLASGVLRNDTIVSPRVEVEVAAWLTSDADVDEALAALSSLPGVTAARVAEVTPDGVRVSLAAEPVPVDRQGEREADLRAAALRALRKRG